MTERVRVLHVPGDHGYVAHLADDDVPGVEAVSAGPADPGGWRPSPALDGGWVRSHAAAFDVLHVHFGFESRTPGQLRDLVLALQAVHRPLVLTVHDLQNPHLTDQRSHTALLDVLVPAAAALVTLTPGAAAEVHRRWGRRAAIVPHPHVAPLGEVGVPRPVRAPGSARVVGLHLKGLRANLPALRVAQTLADAVARLPTHAAGTTTGQDVVLRVDLHEEVLDPAFPRHDAALLTWLRTASADGRLDLRVHDRFDDDALLAYLRDLDVSVLGYAHGTHSGWLELCHDLGVPVLAARVGYLHEQQPLAQADLTDPEATARALRAALDGVPGSAATPQGRRAQRRAVAAAHRDLYRRVASEADEAHEAREAHLARASGVGTEVSGVPA